MFTTRMRDTSITQMITHGNGHTGISVAKMRKTHCSSLFMGRLDRCQSSKSSFIHSNDVENEFRAANKSALWQHRFGCLWQPQPLLTLLPTTLWCTGEPLPRNIPATVCNTNDILCFGVRVFGLFLFRSFVLVCEWFWKCWFESILNRFNSLWFVLIQFLSKFFDLIRFRLNLF